ncbi:hypothetical protein WJX73_003959 [Symbiochloris irregularis]|uniref:Uncharacterized protein n=1 Tax=Symbiochloris irregularis TaxID=706552 RepID=A0AAW1NZ92_9CHLO
MSQISRRSCVLLCTSLLLLSALSYPAIAKEQDEPEEAPSHDQGDSEALLAEVKQLQKELKSKDKEVIKLSKKVQTLQDEHSATSTQLQALQKASQVSDSTATVKLAEAEAQLKTIKAQLEGNAATCSTTQSQLKDAEKQVAHLTTQKDAAVSKSALTEAQEAAAETLKKLNELTTSWLPHWVNHHYTQSVQPHLNSVWDNAGGAATLARQHSASLLAASKLKALETWDTAGPSARNAYDTTQRAFNDAYTTSKKHVGPYAAAGQSRLKQAWSQAAVHLRHLPKHPQVVQVRRALQTQQVQLEKAVAHHMQRYPALKPYAKQPYLAYIVWAALGLPLVILLLPLLLLTGKRTTAVPAVSDSQQDLPEGVVTSDKTSSASTNTASKTRKPRGKKIVEGDETVSFR